MLFYDINNEGRGTDKIEVYIGFLSLNNARWKRVVTMKISSEQLNQVLKIYNRKSRSNSDSKVEKKSKSDKLALSTKAQEVQKASKALENQSAVRQEKVEALKSKIKTGNYNVSGEEVAEKMLSRTIVDNLV